jgi:CheY-like chemotaxis protein
MSDLKKTDSGAAANDASGDLWVEQSKDLIIVLEDSAPNRNILCAILMKLGFEVLSADNGAKGLNLVKRCEDENLKLVAVISDIMMPDMDGLEFLSSFKKNKKFGNVPFVFVTAANDKENVIEAARMGVKHYILKPVTLEQIKNKLNEIFPGKKIGMIKAKKAG